MADKRFVAKNGLDNNSQTITNVAAPANASDAATKAYADGLVTDAAITGKLLTGYTAGSNTALAATDSILAAMGKIQGQISARLTGNQTITLSGGATGSGTTAITVTLSNTAVTGQALTGYAVGTNTALAAADTILGAFQKVQGQINARLTGNQTITLSGDATGSGATAITVAISDATVTGKLLTGYAAGTNTALAATDSILAAMGKIQGQINARLTGNQTITLSGDATGSGATAITVTLKNTGTAGTYTKVTTDAQGRVTSGASLASADLPTYTGTLTSSQITTGLAYTPLNRATVSSDWNTKTDGQASLISGAANSVNGTTVLSGIYLPHASSGFGIQLAGRLDNLYIRTEEAGVWASWRTTLHSGNYNSYSPTLTGTGASGTWAISISGSAATLTTGRTIGMTGDVTWTSAAFNGSGAVTGTATLTNSAVTGQALTGYAVGTNTALAATDTILGAFQKLQGQVSARALSATTLTIANGTGITGGAAAVDLSANRSWTIALTGQALALHNLATNGIIARTAAATVAARTITGTANQITVTNGDGVSGNPTISLPADVDITTTLDVGSVGAITAAAVRVGGDIRASGTIYASDFVLTGGAGSGTGITLDNLDDVVITSPSTNQLLQYNGTSWVNATLTLGTNVTVSDDTTTNATRYISFSTATSGTISALNVSSTKLTFNPSTGVLAASGGFSGLTDGQVTTALGYTPLSLGGGTMTGAITFAAGQTWPTFNQNTTGSATQFNGVTQPTYTSSLRSNVNLSGGGTITFDASGNLLWSTRFIVISNGRGANFTTNGYFDITCPTSGTITGVGGASNKTATAAGIPLAAWEALYYILPIGSANGSVAANFRVASYTADLDIPHTWVLIAVRNGDNGMLYLPHTGNRLPVGTSIATGTYDARRSASADVLTTSRNINGVAFNGSADITVADGTKLPLAGGTMTGAITFAAGQTWPTFNQNTTGSAATLTTARTINGTSFNGSANITTASWGTARTITIGATGKSVDGSGNVSWTVAEIGALSTSGGTSSGLLTAPNFADSTGSYNVNLGSGGSEGRGLVAGYSGGSYGGIGYNIRHTTTGGSYIAPGGDTSSYLLFNAGGFVFYGAAAGTAGRTLSYTTLGSFSAAGTFNAVNVTSGGNQVLHAGNYTSYSPSLTGSGASGTWGINITGNAATATSADQIDGIGFRNTGSNAGVNADTIESNGITYYTGGVTNFSGNATDGALYSQMYSTSWQHQIAGDYRSGQIALRGKNNGTWQSWRTVLDSSNYTSYSPSLTGTGASGTWGISITGNAVTAGGLAVHNTQSTQNSANQIVRTQANGYTMLGWINTTSGDNGTTAIDRVYASSDSYIRYYTPANFRTVLDVPTRTGGSASGTWGISVTGSAGSVAWTNVSGRPTAVSSFTNDSGYLTAGSTINYAYYQAPSGNSNDWVQSFQQTPAHYTSFREMSGNGPAGTWWFAHNYRHSNSGNYWGVQVAWGWEDNANNLYTRNITANSFGGWVRYLNSSNYNSYSPTLTGGGASGTWGINITGNAATITSQANSATITASTGVDANNIVRRDGNGYIYANHINFNTSESENPSINSFFTSNGDGWSRKSTVAHVKNAIRAVADGSWGINITGNSATAAEAQNNYFYVRGTSPSVLFVDTDQGETRYVHHNGGSIGFLNSSGNWVLRCDNSTTYGTFSGSLSGNASSATNATNGRYVYDDGGYSGSAGYKEASAMHVYYAYLGRIVYNNGAYSGSGWVEPSDLGVRYAGTAGVANSVAWGNVSSKPSNIMYYQGFTLNADTMDSNSTGFTYSNNAPHTGPVARFSTGGGYDLWLNATYIGGSSLAFRTRNGDNATLNPWRGILHDGNYGSYALPLSGGTVSGDLRLGSRLGFTGSGNAGDGFPYARFVESYGIRFDSPSKVWVLSTSGSMLVGTGPGGADYGTGNVYASGDVTAYYSDERLKTKLGRIERALEKVLSLEGFRYVENELARSLGYEKEEPQLGVSAQAVQAVAPEVVSLAPFDMTGDGNPHGDGKIISKSGENYLTVKYDRLIPLLIEAIKEQQEHIASLAAQVRTLMENR